MRNLILVGHPDLSQASLANRTIVACLKKQLPDAEIVDLTKTNPDFKIDVPTEQERLKQAQNIVFQFPLYWYSLPAILKAYLDNVFTHGFAHGSTAVLGGKNLIYSFTTGAPSEAYAQGMPMNHPVSDFLYPFRQTAALCNLNFYEVHSCGMMFVPGLSTDEDKQAVEAKAQDHAARLVKLLGDL